MQVVPALQKLARNGMGSLVEACGSAAPVLVGSLHDWAAQGAHVVLPAAVWLHELSCTMHWLT